MKKFLLASVALVALLPSAKAADLGSSAAAVAIVAPATFSWSGLYLGVHVGYGTGRTTFPANDDPVGQNHRYNGVLYGIQTGYNHQFSNNVVIGLEATFSGASINGSALVDAAPPPFNNQYHGTNINFLATFGPRLGYAIDRTLIYAKAGFAAAAYNVWFRDDTGRNSSRNWRGGWFVGAGVEYAVTPNWTVKAEYNYIDLGSGNWNFGERFINHRTRMDIHTFTVGVNYLFSTGPSAVVARY